ncbi:MAG: SIS domain-containing protein [Ardenticatenaceae bacterium]|nr:SIS domain-containing protein [Ardenticatenaceae bacterium]MCB8947376.1 SIS domain-containing protein [Ardenticatenaceae bacterium]
MNRSPLHQQVDTLPDLVLAMIDELVTAVRHTITPSLSQKIERVFTTGCGDSYFAPLNAELAFEQLAGLPCEPMTAMQFARYAVGFLPETGRGSNLVLAVSVSGAVSRTVEAMALARQAGATAVALTGNPEGPLGQAAEFVLETAVPPLPAELQGLIVPGTRSYVASQLALYLCAIQLGEHRGHLPKATANKLRRELAHMAELMAHTIALSDKTTRQATEAWHDADQFVFCGAGPNLGTAQFSAAKILEASGDTAVAQDTEEWAHLQYFGRQVATPTVFIGAGGWDEGRALELVTAAKAIGRRVAAIAPRGSALAAHPELDFVWETAVPTRECFSPLLTCLPGTLFAAYRAQLLDEPYFRGFGGGRSVEGGGGISRIRSSEEIDEVRR